MEALHAAVKAELGEDGLPVSGGTEVTPHAARPPNPHGRLKFLPTPVPVQAAVKLEFGLLVFDEVNAAIKSEAPRTDSARAAASRPPAVAVHGLTGGVAHEEGWWRVQPTRGAKRRAASFAVVGSGVSHSADNECASMAPRRRWKATRVKQSLTAAVVGLSPLPPGEDVVWEQHLASLK
jgi:hypothetical protein